MIKMTPVEGITDTVEALLASGLGTLGAALELAARLEAQRNPIGGSVQVDRAMGTVRPGAR